MRKSSLKTNFKFFYDRIDYYGDFLEEITESDLLFDKKGKQKGRLTIFDKREIVEMFVLKFDVMWQSFIRDLFLDCLCRDLTKYSEATFSNLPKHLPWSVCRAMVNGLGYFDFKNISDVRAKGNKYLVDKYNPFIEIDGEQCKKIDEFSVLRNVIAHESHFSSRKLRIMYENKHGINKYIQPSIFLMGLGRETGCPRLVEYLVEMQKVAKKMEKFLIKQKLLK